MTKIIVFEGLDLSGKSTQLNNLAMHLTANGYCVSRNKGTLGKIEILSKEEESQLSRFEKDLYYTHLLLMDKYSHIDTMSDYVLQDRYYPSVIYYGVTQFPHRSLANKVDLSSFRQPDLFIHLRCSHDQRVGRLKLRKTINEGDLLTTQNTDESRIRQSVYDDIMGRIQDKYGNVLTIDTSSDSEDQTLSKILCKI